MSEHNTHLNTVPVDELWLGDWAAEGISALERYLTQGRSLPVSPR
jgi:hypothetical protein